MNEPIRLQLEIVIPAEAVFQIAELLTPQISPEQKRLENSRRAIYAGEKPPESEALLLDTRGVARLLKVSERTVFSMYTEGAMPNHADRASCSVGQSRDRSLGNRGMPASLGVEMAEVSSKTASN